MGPTRTVKTKIPAHKSSKSSSSSRSEPSRSKVSKSSKSAKPPTTKQQKTKSRPSGPMKKKRKVYTAEELGVPALNGIVPTGVIKPKGKKKGKVFVDDQEQQMTILAIVNAEMEGKVEGKMVKQRKLEEVREARRIEAEKKEERRRGVLEGAKDEIKRGRKAKKKFSAAGSAIDVDETMRVTEDAKGKRKSVSFA